MRHSILAQSLLASRFQSTHPGWGATFAFLFIIGNDLTFQSTHPGWGATGFFAMIQNQLHHFNPRTPGGVRRPTSTRSNISINLFQSTHPGWGATSHKYGVQYKYKFISIHAPRVGCDPLPPLPDKYKSYDFNPRTPGGVRPLRIFRALSSRRISIHAPRVGCDRRARIQSIAFPFISIHAPRVGCDIRRKRRDV